MSDLNTTFVDGPAGGTPIDAAYLNAVSQAARVERSDRTPDGLVAKLDQVSASAVVVILGDSTGIPGTGEWVGDWAAMLGARWTGHRVTTRLWGGSSYGSTSTVANGSASLTLDIYNGSVGGAKADYPVSRVAAMLPVQPDLVVVNYGHNYGSDSAATFQSSVDALVSAVRSTWANAPVVVSSQNPEFSPAANVAAHAARETAKRAWAETRGYGYVPAWEAFQAQATPSAFVQSDGVHPTTSGTNDGSALWGAVADAFVAARSRRPAVSSAAPSGITVQEDGVTVGTGITQVNFVGAGSTAAGAGTGKVDVSIPGGGAGATVYKGRDRLVASAGDNTLTLGATPVAGSPLIWVNNVIKWPTTNYTISGGVITFTSALTAGDVVLVYYDTTTSSPAASALSGAAVVDIQDDFNRADSSTSLGSTSVGSKAWTAHTGTWGILTGKAALYDGSASQVNRATINSGTATGTVTGTFEDPSGQSPDCGFVVRSDGAGNEYLVQFKVGGAAVPQIFKGVGGSYTSLASGASVTVASGSVMTVELVGNTITVKDDGVTIVSVTDSTYPSNTRHGLYFVAPSGMASWARADNFKVHS